MSPKFKNVSEVVTLVLAIIAIAFAIIQFVDSRHLQRSSQDLQNSSKILQQKIKFLLDETSTKYIGSFPYNMDDINSTLGRAQEEVCVLVDFPGYGHYSQPRKHRDYADKILQLRQAKKKVRMLFYSAAAQLAKVHDQFKPADWGKIRGTQAFKEFFGTYHPDQEAPNSYDGFINRLLGLQLEYERGLCNNGVEIEHIDQPSVLFLWLDDEDSAVFAINNGGGKDRELSFHTSDGKLIHSFRSMFDRFWDDNRSDPQRCPK
ncbi:MAG TPA: hypothetical protein VGG20_07960 [Thermoanaerobaculia bacterium]|jgi:hypothetical protein